MFVFYYSASPSQLGEYPGWLILFLIDIIWPCIGIVSIAIKILLKHGNGIKKEVFQYQLNVQNATISNSVKIGTFIIINGQSSQP